MSRLIPLLVIAVFGCGAPANSQSYDPPGDIRNFGAIAGDGIDDSFAFQAAIDSGHAVTVPVGCWKASGLQINKPTVFNLTQPMATGFDGDTRRIGKAKPGPVYCESHARVWTDQNEHMFTIKAPSVYFNGGVFDAQSVQNWDKAIFYYPGASVNHLGNSSCIGGGANNFVVMGNYQSMYDGVGTGGYGVYIDFLSPEAIRWACYTDMSWSGSVYGVRVGWYASPRGEGMRHWANSSYIHLYVNSSEQSLVNHSFGGLRAIIRHQGAYVFYTEQESLDSPSVFSDRNIILQDPEFWDFSHQCCPVKKITPEWGVEGDRWLNRYSVELLGDENVIEDSSVVTRPRAKFIGGSVNPYRYAGTE